MDAPHYKIMPDEVEPGKFRVAHFGSEYTVSHKKKLLHGLSRYKARKMLQELEDKRQNAISRLAEAFTEYWEEDPPPARAEAFISYLSVKHRIDRKCITTGLLMNAGGINAGAER